MVNLAGGSANFANPNVGTNKTVTFSGYTLSGADAGDYALIPPTSTGTANITSAPLVITAGSPTLTYGFGGTSAALGTSAFTISSGQLFGSDSVTSVTLSTNATLSSSSNYNVGTWHLTPSVATGSGLGNYDIYYTAGTLQVNAKALTVTALNQSRTYGDVNPVFTYSITGLVNNDYLDQSELVGGVVLTSTAAGPDSPAGNYSIFFKSCDLAVNVPDPNYFFDLPHCVSGMLIILPAPLTIALNMPSYLTRSYGAANPSLNLPLDDFSYTGFVNGDNQDDALTGTPSVSTVATMTSPVGSYPITINAGSLSSPNYTFTFESETLTVVPAVLTVTSVTATRTYGTTTANTQFYTIIGFANGQVLATSDVTGTPGIATTTTATSSVGTYPGTPALGTLKSTNYTFAFAPGTGTLQITPVQLTVSADDISRFYGLANPNLTYTITGFANGETAATGGVTGSPLLSTTAVASSPVGTYPITVQKGTLAATNYDFVILENFGVLTVNTAWLIVRAHDVEQSFGTPNPQSLGWDLVREDAPQTIVSAADPDPELTGTPTLSTQANSDSNSGVGTYPITPTQGTLSVGNPNYALDTSSFQSGTFTITPAPLTITANNVKMTYADGTTLSGDSGYTVSDPVEGSLSVTLSTNATFSSSHNYNAGTWNITPSAAIGSELSNYSITYIAGQLTVNQLGLTVSGLTASKGYNDNITTGITIGGTASLNTPVSGDNVSLNAASAWASFDNANVGTTHTVNFSGYALSGSDSANYSLTQPSITTGVITAAPLTITANNQTQTYGFGGSSASLGTTLFSVSGTLYGSDHISNVTLTTDDTKSGGGDYIATSGPGTANHPANISPASAIFFVGIASNYSITYTADSGQLTINQLGLTVSGLTASKGYNGNTTTGITIGGTASLNTPVSFDNVSLNAASAWASFDNANVGTTHTVTFSGYALSGSDNANYSLTQPSIITGVITPAPLTISANNQTQTYGFGGSSASLGTTLFSVSGTLYGSDHISGVTLTTNDTTSGGGDYIANSGPGTANSPANISPASAIFSVGIASNYSVTYTADSGQLTINQLGLTVSGLTASKGYNGNTTTGITIGGTASLNTPVSDDNVSLNAVSAWASFDNANVGTTHTVTFSGYALSGSDSANYSLTQPSITTGVITAAPLTITANNQTQTYGFGGSSASLGTTLFSVSGTLYGSDHISGVTLTTDDTKSGGGDYIANSGPGTANSPANISPASAIFSLGTASNYSITYTADSGQLTVNQLGLTVSGLTASKGYNGNTTTGITIGGSASLNTPVSDDNVSLNAASASASFDNANVGATHTVTFSGYALSGSDSANYSLTQPSIITGVITAAPLTIRANNQTQTYGFGGSSASLGTTLFSVSGPLYGSDHISGVTLITDDTKSGGGDYIANSGPGTANSPANISPASAVFAVGIASNYSITYTADSGQLTVNQLGLTVSGLTASKGYNGDTTTGITIGGTASLNIPFSDDNDYVSLNAASASASFDNANVGTTHTVNFSGYALSGSDSANYSLTQPSIITGVITAAPLTIRANNQSKIYGFGGTSAALGTSAFKVSFGTLYGTDQIRGVTLTTDDTTSGGGDYIATSGPGTANSPANISPVSGSAVFAVGIASNYSITYTADSGQLTVNQLGLTISGLTASKDYDGSITIGGTASLNTPVSGDNVSLNAASASASFDNTNVGTTTVTFSGYALSGSDSANYSLTQPSITTGVITPAPLTITADNQTQIYGFGGTSTALGTSAFTFSGLCPGDSVSSVTLSTNASLSGSSNYNVGTWTLTPIAVHFLIGSSSNYTITYVNASTGLTITPAPLTITASESQTYGFGGTSAALGTTAFTASGLFGSDSVTSVTLTTNATLSSSSNYNAGTWDIAPSAAIGSGLSNYTITYDENSTGLTVAAKALTLTALDQNRSYGDVNPALTYTITGLVPGDFLDSSELTGSPDIPTTAVDYTSGAGVYHITIHDLGNLKYTDPNSNYTFQNALFVDGMLTIQPAPLTITAVNVTRVYGQSNPALTPQYSGFVNGETVTTSDLTGSPSLSTAATTASAAGTYSIVVGIGSLASTDYTLSYEPGTLTVTPAVLTVTTVDATRSYGAANPTLSCNITGFISGETLLNSDLTGTPGVSSAATPTSPVGSYAVTPALGTLKSNNYTFAFQAGTLTVTPAVLTVAAVDVSRAYGVANPTLTYTISGFVNGETAATGGVTGTPALSTTADANSSVGTYTITVGSGTLNATNYSFQSSGPGTLTITPALLIVQAQNLQRSYGTTNPPLAYTLVREDQPQTVVSALASGASGAPALSTSGRREQPRGELRHHRQPGHTGRRQPQLRTRCLKFRARQIDDHAGHPGDHGQPRQPGLRCSRSNVH